MSLRGLFADLFLNGACYIKTGSGSPESSVTAGIGSLYLRTTAGAGTVLYVKESGTGNTGWVAMSSASASTGGNIQKATVTLTDAQVKALPTTPITLVAAQGSGFQIIPIMSVLRAKFSAGAYTNINAAALMGTEYAGGQDQSGYLANVAGATPVLTKVTTLLGANNSTVVLQPYVQNVEPIADEWGVFPSIQSTGNLDNVALRVYVDNGGSGNFTGGNAANTLPITTYYTVEPV